MPSTFPKAPDCFGCPVGLALKRDELDRHRYFGDIPATADLGWGANVGFVAG